MTDSLSTINRAISDAAHEADSQTVDVYRSSNGDVWQLVRDNPTGRHIVRHTPNAASGGSVSEMSVEEFLARNGSSPQGDALHVLMSAKHSAPTPAIEGDTPGRA